MIKGDKQPPEMALQATEHRSIRATPISTIGASKLPAKRASARTIAIRMAIAKVSRRRSLRIQRKAQNS